jgi:hypothetical protein
MQRAEQTPTKTASGKTKQEHGFQGFLRYTVFSNFLQVVRDGYLYSRVRPLQDPSGTTPSIKVSSGTPNMTLRNALAFSSDPTINHKKGW